MTNLTLSKKQCEEILKALKARFEKNMNRHQGLEWTKAQAKLEANAKKLWSLHEMERTGGEPDVIAHDKKTGEHIFYDCSAESPKGRRSLCYDREALVMKINGLACRVHGLREAGHSTNREGNVGRIALEVVLARQAVLRTKGVIDVPVDLGGAGCAARVVL